MARRRAWALLVMLCGCVREGPPRVVFFDADPSDGPAIDHLGMFLGQARRL
jgi:hypothetical protein